MPGELDMVRARVRTISGQGCGGTVGGVGGEKRFETAQLELTFTQRRPSEKPCGVLARVKHTSRAEGAKSFPAVKRQSSASPVDG